MVQLVEITGVLNEKGCIEIPIVLLAQTGIRTGEEVNLIYLAAGEKDYRNESREFMLKRAEEDPLEELQSGETELKLPPQLLADAHIPLDADLDIVCLDRKIVILPTEDVESEDVPKELLDICADLGIPREKVNIVLRMTEEENGKKQIREYTKPLFSIPTHAFLFNAGNIDAKFYIDTLQLEKSEYNLIRYPQRGVCLYKCGNERYNLMVHAPEYKEKLFGSAGGR